MVLEFKEVSSFNMLASILEKEGKDGWKLYQYIVDGKGTRHIILCRPKI